MTLEGIDPAHVPGEGIMSRIARAAAALVAAAALAAAGIAGYYGAGDNHARPACACFQR